MDDELQKRLGRRIREYRKHLGYSQAEFAEHLGLQDHRYIGSIERGERNFTLQTLEAYAKRLGVDPLDLLAHDE